MQALDRDLRDLDDRSAESRAVVALDQQSVGRLSRMDAIQQQAMAQAAARNRKTELARIAAALARIDAGTYGECLACGEEIAEARLDADPAATLCIACARSR
ncbi:MAG TPA: TraR/DksA C4-type zinc finger protein [Methylomirabilota bacterium]|nr:TraR/DksA C4-type zinc finger protein [Methylomirabilota bacterium]